MPNYFPRAGRFPRDGGGNEINLNSEGLGTLSKEGRLVVGNLPLLPSAMEPLPLSFCPW